MLNNNGFSVSVRQRKIVNCTKLNEKGALLVRASEIYCETIPVDQNNTREQPVSNLYIGTTFHIKQTSWLLIWAG